MRESREVANRFRVLGRRALERPNHPTGKAIAVITVVLVVVVLLAVMSTFGWN